MKKLTHIIAIIIFFTVAAQAQNHSGEATKAEKEKIEFASLNAFIDYVEAVKKGEAAPIDKVILEKEYTRLIQKMDKEFHSPTSTEKNNQPSPETTSDISNEILEDLK